MKQKTVMYPKVGDTKIEYTDVIKVICLQDKHSM